MDFTFYVYKCPQCEREFRAFLPFAMREQVVAYKFLLDEFVKMQAAGHLTNEESVGFADQLEKMEKGYATSLEILLSFDKAKAEIKTIEEEYSLLIKREKKTYQDIGNQSVKPPAPNEIN